MSQIARYLLPNEQHAIEVRHHWAYLGAGALTTCAFWAGGLIVLALFKDLPLIRFASVFFLFFSLCWFAWLIGEWWVERFVVTDRRVLLLTGLLTKRVAIMPLAKVTDLTYERSLAGRVLGYGVFIMESAGQQQALQRIPYIPDPDTLYRQVTELLFGDKSLSSMDDGTGNPTVGGPGGIPQFPRTQPSAGGGAAGQSYPEPATPTLTAAQRAEAQTSPLPHIP